MSEEKDDFISGSSNEVIRELRERLSQAEAEIESRKKLSGELHKYHPDILALEARLSQALRVGYKCEHIDKEQIGGDCVHCNLVVAEGSVLSLQKRLSQAEKLAHEKMEHPLVCTNCAKVMDVAGKMAETLRDIADGEVSLEMLDEMTRENWCRKWARTRLSEWDGIKEDSCG